jgi:16S rRNA (cytidine1402-2'-O)-methyltransferase
VSERPQTGALILVATPIGNLGDVSARAAEALRDADVVAAEDTRRTRALLTHLGFPAAGRLRSVHAHNEQESAEWVVEAVRDGRRVAYVTDAGTPGISDPGERLVRACLDAGLTVDVVPGPSAVLTALAVSGLPVDRFCFEGFLPRKAGERGRRLAALATEERTMVFFEAPHRTEAALAAMADALGDDRPAAVCRELTKTHEEVRRGPLAELVAWAADGVRGEVTIVVEGSSGAPAVDTDPGSLRAAVAGLEESGSTRKEAIAEVARRAGLPKREVYDVVHR